MYVADDLTEDIGICHIVTGAHYEFMKMNLLGLHDAMKVNELIRIDAQLKKNSAPRKTKLHDSKRVTSE